MANTMNRPNASSLFHFTDSLEVLKAIITNGLLFSYSYEEHDFLNLPKEDLPDFKGIAIPMEIKHPVFHNLHLQHPIISCRKPCSCLWQVLYCAR